MGKSKKKIKSERINLLRKQYDTFLEEDKKRKQRNEYILGRLDKMRNTTALVFTRHKPTVLAISKPPLYGLRVSEVPLNNCPQNKIVNRYKLLQNDRLQKVDDALIQEISNNYILIPKLRSSFTNNYEVMPENNQQHSTRDDQRVEECTFDKNNTRSWDNNWQSKYEILNTLKKEEKGTTPQYSTEYKSAPHTKSETHLNDNHEKNSGNFLTENKCLDEFPEKDISIKKINEEFKYDNGYITINPDPVVHDEIKNNNDVSARNFDIVDEIACKLQNTNLEYTNFEANFAAPIDDYTNYAGNEEKNYAVVNSTHPQIDLTKHVKQSEYVYGEEEITKPKVEINAKDYIENQNKLLNESDIISEQIISVDPKNVVYADEQEVISPQVTKASSLMEVNNDSSNAPKDDLTDYIKYDTEIAKTNKNTPDIDYRMRNNTDASASQKCDEEQLCMETALDNQEPEKLSDVKETEKELIDNAGIEAFDIEQREMFYAEHPAEKYGYEQGEVNEDEQGYQLNETENQNQEYSYYDNVQQDAYPIGLDGNEEETLRYDPAYQQQYTYSYEKAYEQHQTPPNEEQQNNNTIQPEDLEPPYEEQNNDTHEQVESALDTEEGYSEQKLDKKKDLDEPSETIEK